jgi:molybdopterin-guanine dinucleotide biosynthesis protein
MKPLIVLIGGAYSGCGKTTFGTGLIKGLGRGWSVIKYTKTGFYSSIIINREIISQEDKDTARYVKAGAEDVLWLQSPPENLREMLKICIDRLSDSRGIIIEGNSPIEFLTPDVVVFVDGHERPPKKSSEMVRKKANVIVNPLEFITAMEETKELIDKKIALREELIKKAINNRIPCSLARKIAETHGLKYREIGEMADALGIKITDCELGCF